MGQVNELKQFSRGQIDAALMKIGQDVCMGTAEGIYAWLRGDLIIQLKSLPFHKNEHGHYVLKITGLAITGEQETNRMKEGGYNVDRDVKQIFASTNADSYDANHRLEEGKEYNIVLILGNEMRTNRTTMNVQQYGAYFGYQKILAGAMPRIREMVSDKHMEQMDIQYIVGLHTPIKSTDDDPYVLTTCLENEEYNFGLFGRWGGPGDRWRDGGAFAFFVLAS